MLHVLHFPIHDYVVTRSVGIPLGTVLAGQVNFEDDDRGDREAGTLRSPDGMEVSRPWSGDPWTRIRLSGCASDQRI
jgi:hypothetical protein